MEKEIICLSCPNGCHITVEKTSTGQYQFQGAKCERGEVYAHEEVTDPKRVVTAVVQTDSEEMPYIPVKTDKPIPKRYIKPLLSQLYKQKISLPAKCGQVIIQNFMGTEVNVVITRTFPLILGK
ncbi:MAG: DUF1667 domain-containing protein [Candidatus Hydrogenedens sp.]